MYNDNKSKSYESTVKSHYNLLDFDDFLETLDPEIRARYKASHYKLRDEEGL